MGSCALQASKPRVCETLATVGIHHPRPLTLTLILTPTLATMGIHPSHVGPHPDMDLDSDPNSTIPLPLPLISIKATPHMPVMHAPLPCVPYRPSCLCP